MKARRLTAALHHDLCHFRHILISKFESEASYQENQKSCLLICKLTETLIRQTTHISRENTTHT